MVAVSANGKSFYCCLNYNRDFAPVMKKHPQQFLGITKKEKNNLRVTWDIREQIGLCFYERATPFDIICKTAK